MSCRRVDSPSRFFFSSRVFLRGFSSIQDDFALDGRLFSLFLIFSSHIMADRPDNPLDSVKRLLSCGLRARPYLNPSTYAVLLFLLTFLPWGFLQCVCVEVLSGAFPLRLIAPALFRNSSPSRSFFLFFPLISVRGL